MRSLSYFVSVIVAVAACSNGSTNGGYDNPTRQDASTSNGSDGSGSSADAPPATIASLRQSPPATGTVVTLTNVVVVGSVSSTKYGHIWVQDAGGGQYTGIQVFCAFSSSTAPCSLTRAALDALKPGAIVTVNGQFTVETPSATAPTGTPNSLEIDSPTVTVGTTMGSAVAVSVDAATLAMGNYAAGGPADAYKGAYVEVTASAVTASSVDPAEFEDSCTGMGSGSGSAATGTTYDGFEATSGSTTLAIAFTFYDSLTYCLPCSAANPYPCANAVTASEAFTTVRGVVEADYSSSAGDVYLQISPVVDTDLVQ
jgi:hypothetical protein